jgi:fructose-bisphosphate aldolase class I
MSNAHLAQLEATAAELVAPGKGILAADESTGTIKKRFDSIGVESTEDRRRAYRSLLFLTEGLSEFVSGMICYDETVRQKLDDDTPLPRAMSSRGIIPGIKVDTGAKVLAGRPAEKVTEGLDGLRDRVAEYVELGCRFAKWRAVITIGDGMPSDYCISTNAHALARYARLCQEGGLVPIVEPEVLMDGDHDIDTCMGVTQRTLSAVFRELFDQGVHLEGMLLKPNMVISGKTCATQAGVAEVADRTVRCLRRTVPAAVPGIVFLSGGQSDELATAHLDAMNRGGSNPWTLSFSYGRALQAPALKAWGGQDDKVAAAQAALLHRAKCNGAAATGSYDAAWDAA